MTISDPEKVTAFKRIYQALRAAQSRSIFKLWLKSDISDTLSETKDIEAYCKKNPTSRAAKAWSLTNELIQKSKQDSNSLSLVQLLGKTDDQATIAINVRENNLNSLKDLNSLKEEYAELLNKIHQQTRWFFGLFSRRNTLTFDQLIHLKQSSIQPRHTTKIINALLTGNQRIFTLLSELSGPENTNQPISKWMEHRQSDLGEKKLSELYLPGTHDSATSHISEHSATNNATPAHFKWLMNHAPRWIKRIIAGWSKAQEKTIYEQLSSGIRYLDIRLAESLPSNVDNVDNVKAFHALEDQNLTDILNDIQNFLRNNTMEIVILDINHWYPHIKNPENKNKMAEKVLNKIHEQFHQNIAPAKQYSPHSNLNQLWDREQNLIVCSTEIPSEGNYSWVWKSSNTHEEAFQSNDPLISFWPNQENPKSLARATKSALTRLRNNSNNTALTVIQTQPTPAFSIFNALFHRQPTNLEELSASSKPPVYKELDNAPEDKGAIFIEDFADTKFASKIIGLNFRNSNP